MKIVKFATNKVKIKFPIFQIFSCTIEHKIEKETAWLKEAKNWNKSNAEKQLESITIKLNSKLIIWFKQKYPPSLRKILNDYFRVQNTGLCGKLKN